MKKNLNIEQEIEIATIQLDSAAQAIAHAHNFSSIIMLKVMDGTLVKLQREAIQLYANMYVNAIVENSKDEKNDTSKSVQVRSDETQ